MKNERPAARPPKIEIAGSPDAATVAAFRRLIPQLGPGHDEPTKATLARILGSPSNTVLLARDPESHAIIGALTLTIVDTATGCSGWIADVVVDEASRGSGAGQALVREALRLAAKKGAGYVDLTSRPARTAANRLYQSMGFEKRNTNYYRYAIEPAKG